MSIKIARFRLSTWVKAGDVGKVVGGSLIYLAFSRFKGMALGIVEELLLTNRKLVRPIKAWD